MLHSPINHGVNLDAYFASRRQPLSEPRTARAFKLWPRQKDIIRLITQDKGNKEIAFELGIAFGTVRRQVYTLIRKLGVKSRVGIAVWACQNPELVNE